MNKNRIIGTKHSANHSTPKRRLLAAGRVLVFATAIVVFLVLYVAFADPMLQRYNFEKELGTLPIPTGWSKIETSRTPENFFGTCLTYPDVACPGVGMTYLVRGNMSLVPALTAIRNHLLSQGYKEKYACLDDTCGNNVVRYSINLYKGQSAVGASVEKHGSTQFIYIGVGKN